MESAVLIASVVCLIIAAIGAARVALRLFPVGRVDAAGKGDAADHYDREGRA